MPFIPPTNPNFTRESTRYDEQALELKAEHYAQTHLSEEDRELSGRALSASCTTCA